MVDNPERDPEVGGDALEVEIVCRDGLVGHALDACCEGCPKGGRRESAVILRAFAGKICREPSRPVGSGHDVTPDGLGQCPDEGGDQLVAQSRYLPVESGIAQPREQRHRYHSIDSIVGCTRLEAVAERKYLIALCPPGGVLVAARRSRALGEVGLAHVEQARCAVRGLTPPGLERADVEDLARDPRVVEREHRLITGQDVAATLPLLELLQAPPHVRVTPVEGSEALVEVRGIPFALHERVADEELACERPIEAGQLHAALRDDLYPEQGHLLVRGCRTRRSRPVRLAQLTVGELAGELLGPGWVDRCDRSGEQARGFDEFCRHDGIRALLAKPRAREDCEARAAGSPVFGGGAPWLPGSCTLGCGRRRAVIADADLREQPRQDRAMDGIGVGVDPRLRAPCTHEVRELSVHIDPFAHAHVVEELGPAHPPKRARAELYLHLL